MDFFLNNEKPNMGPLTDNRMIVITPSSNSNISFIPYSIIIKCMNCEQLFYNEEFVQHICNYDSNKKLIILENDNGSLPILSSISKKSNNETIKRNTKVFNLCDICGKFIAIRNFKSHVAFIHRGKKSNHCKYCNKKFTTRQDLNNHIRSLHTGERPYHCSVCDKSFHTGSTFYQHQLIHKDERRRYSCVICDNKYYRAWALKNHLRIHTGEKPFQCVTCLNTFRQKFHVLNHIRNSHLNIENTGYIVIKSG